MKLTGQKLIEKSRAKQIARLDRATEKFEGYYQGLLAIVDSQIDKGLSEFRIGAAADPSWLDDAWLAETVVSRLTAEGFSDVSVHQLGDLKYADEDDNDGAADDDATETEHPDLHHWCFHFRIPYPSTDEEL